ncbi:MAG: DUF2480 family protein [Saprospiraceae bacterium]|nr:DUF2480 family protein [Saprospiraceae bacterium]
MNETSQILVNRVASSGIVTINLEDYYPKSELVEFDMKDFLFKELILKELDFRKSMQELDWLKFKDKILCVYCSNNAIIPKWAFMLVARYAQDVVRDLIYGNKEKAVEILLETKLRMVDWSQFKDQKIVLKGCGDIEIPVSAYQTASYLLLPFANSIMYGEPCSTVPIFKKKKTL